MKFLAYVLEITNSRTFWNEYHSYILHDSKILLLQRMPVNKKVHFSPSSDNGTDRPLDGDVLPSFVSN